MTTPALETGDALAAGSDATGWLDPSGAVDEDGVSSGRADATDDDVTADEAVEPAEHAPSRAATTATHGSRAAARVADGERPTHSPRGSLAVEDTVKDRPVDLVEAALAVGLLGGAVGAA